MAHLVDSVILNLIGWFVEEALTWGMYGVYRLILLHRSQVPLAKADVFDPFLLQGISAAIYVALSSFYFIYGHWKFQTTWGKKLLSIRVVDELSEGAITLKQSAVRYLGYFLSYLTFGCGFAMAAFHPKKKGLHDLMAHTVSVVADA